MNPHLTRFVPLLIRILISDDFILEKQRDKKQNSHIIYIIYWPFIPQSNNSVEVIGMY